MEGGGKVGIKRPHSGAGGDRPTSTEPLEARSPCPPNPSLPHPPPTDPPPPPSIIKKFSFFPASPPQTFWPPQLGCQSTPSPLTAYKKFNCSHFFKKISFDKACYILRFPSHTDVTASAHNVCPQKNVQYCLSPYSLFLSAAIDETGLLSPPPSYSSLRVSTYRTWIFLPLWSSIPGLLLAILHHSICRLADQLRVPGKKCREKEGYIPSSRGNPTSPRTKNRFFRTRS